MPRKFLLNSTCVCKCLNSWEKYHDCAIIFSLFRCVTNRENGKVSCRGNDEEEEKNLVREKEAQFTALCVCERESEGKSLKREN